MKKDLWKRMVTVLGIMVLLTTMTGCSSGGEYDFVLQDPSMKKLLETYSSKIRTERILMDYLNLIVDSPQSLIKVLERDDCEKSMLNFTRKNPDLVLALVHVTIIQTLNQSNVNDNQLIYVTGVIQDPKAQAATTGVQYQMEKEFLRKSFPSYAIYEVTTARNGVKDMVEAAFHGMKKSQKQKGK